MSDCIALLADVHGNKTALQAVIEDSIKQEVTEYWFIGDLLLPGPASIELLDQLKKINTTVFVRGNWDDIFLEVLAGKIDINDPTDVYVAKLTMHFLEQMDQKAIQTIQNWPLHTTEIRQGLQINISHNLPDKNYGPALAATNDQSYFDSLFKENESDLAIYAHVHHQLLRYSTNDQLIINPGSIGQPANNWPKLQTDLRAGYAILEIDDAGIAQINFRKVAYDKSEEIRFANKTNLPYLELYKKIVQFSNVPTHNRALLNEYNEKFGYKQDVANFMQTHFKKE